MTRKTLKERQEALRTWTLEAADLFAPVLEASRPKMFSRAHYMKDGDAYFHCYCEKCGSEYDELITQKTGNYCRKCYNKHTLTNSSCNPVFVQFTDDGWTAIRFYADYQQGAELSATDEPFASLKSPINIVTRTSYVMQYDKSYGFLILFSFSGYKELKFIKTDSAKYKDVRYSFTRKSHAFSMDNEEIDMGTLIEQSEAEWTKKCESTPKTVNKKSQQEETMRTSYIPKQVDPEKLINSVDNGLYIRYADIGNKVIYKMACLHCGTIFEAENSLEIYCPHCGQVHEIAHNYDHPYQDYHLLVFENTDLPDDDLLLRVFKGRCELRRKPDGQYHIIRTASEHARFFLGKKKYAYKVENKVLTKIKAELSAYSCADTYMYTQRSMHTKEELRDIIANSYLRHSGAIEAMGLGNPVYKPVNSMHELSYIKCWYANKAIEYIYKAQLPTLTRECIAYGMPRLNSGSSVNEVLDLTPLGLKIVRQCELRMDDLKSLRILCKCDPTLTVEGYRQLSESINPVEAAELAENYGIRWKEIVDYLEGVYMHQCIEKDEAVTVWRDYLSMAKRLGYALNEKSRKFPNSLRKEHDIVTFATNALAEAETHEVFLAQAEKNHDKYYYTYEKLMAIVPKSTEDVIQEATQQHNCLRSYIRSIQDGSTAVAFIRRKDQPDKSFVTVEIRDTQILQIRGFANSSPRCPELTEFLQHWIKAKKLKIACSY